MFRSLRHLKRDSGLFSPSSALSALPTSLSVPAAPARPLGPELPPCHAAPLSTAAAARALAASSSSAPAVSTAQHLLFAASRPVHSYNGGNSGGRSYGSSGSSYSHSPPSSGYSNQSPASRYASHNNNSNSNGASTFVSSHVTMERADILSYLARRNIVYKDYPDKVGVMDCPFCKPTYNRPDNQWKLAIFPSGGFNCVRCGSSGSWYDFKQRLGDLPAITDALDNPVPVHPQSSYNSASSGSKYGSNGPPASGGRHAGVAVGTAPAAGGGYGHNGYAAASAPLSQSEAASWAASLDAFPDVLAYLTGAGPGQRGLARAVLDLYNVGAKLHQFPAPYNANSTGSGGGSGAVQGTAAGNAASLSKLAAAPAAHGNTRGTAAVATVSSAQAGKPGQVTWIDHPCVTFPWARAPLGSLRSAPAATAATAANDTGGRIMMSPPPKSATATAPAASVTATLGKTSAAHAKIAFQCVPLPPCPRNLEYDRVKLRSIVDKSSMRILPKGGDWGFFGWHTIPESATEIIITEGEYDAMAVCQATGRPAISLPNGCRSFPVQLLPCLERFTKITLWLDDDGPGRDGAESIAKKLGMSRCRIVGALPWDAAGAADEASYTPPKDANDALRMRLNLESFVTNAQPCSHKEIASFPSFRQDVRRMFTNPNEHVGVPLPNMPHLQSLVKGHRRGELSIFTGPTGVGKTTILAQLSLEVCQQNVPTLWGSFEIRNPRLVRTLMMQYAAHLGVVLNTEHVENFDYVADRFQELPMHFLKFYGSSPVQEVLDAMDYAVYVHDVQHIILDNLQFMLSGQGKSGMDKFDIQDKALESFRQFASQRNVHVSLVIHPRKEADNSSLGMSSVFGSAKATQEADNVFIIQSGLPRSLTKPLGFEGKGKGGGGGNGRPDLAQHGGYDDPLVGEVLATFFRTLELRKNRWDGDLGAVPMRFDRASNRLFELTSEDVQTGLAPFVEKHRKLKQMDLIKHMHQNANAGGAGAGPNNHNVVQGFNNNSPAHGHHQQQQQPQYGQEIPLGGSPASVPGQPPAMGAAAFGSVVAPAASAHAPVGPPNNGGRVPVAAPKLYNPTMEIILD